MTGALPFATDACHAVSKRSVKIIAWDSSHFGQKVMNQESPTQRGSNEIQVGPSAEKQRVTPAHSYLAQSKLRARENLGI